MAEIKCSYDTNRAKLSEIIPLNSPMSMYIEPTKKCNFKCFYCMHSTRGRKPSIFESTGYECTDIDETLFKKIVEEIINLKTQPKRICFSGLGEPLMNSSLPNMIAYLRSSGYSGRIDIITNGYLLTPNTSTELIKAGVSRIQISVQGLCSDDYLKNCGVKIDYKNFVKNIAFLYQNRKHCRIYIKIIDAMLNNDSDKQKFYDIFSPICDQIFIEHLIVMEQQMGDHGNRVDPSRNLNNEKFILRDVCPVCFYHLQITKEGFVFPCPVPGLPKQFSLGDIHDNTISEIWESSRRKNFLFAQLQRQRYKISPCGTCVACAAVMDENENLDNDSEIILKRMMLNNGGK